MLRASNKVVDTLLYGRESWSHNDPVLSANPVESDPRSLNWPFSSTHNKDFFRRIQIRRDGIVKLFRKMFIAAWFEGFDQIRLEVMLLPYLAYRGLTEPVSLGHAAGTLVSCLEGF